MTAQQKKDNEPETFQCMKHHTHIDVTGLKCPDPELYCKFRSGCIIWFMSKEKNREEAPKDNK
jgi:hypothetical protein